MAPRTPLQKLSLVCLASSIVPSTSALSVAISAAQALGVLQQRDLTCSNHTFTSCSSTDSKLPTDFCCAPDSDCVSLDSSSSAICCPTGQNCAQIQGISCDVGIQNATQFPTSALFTTRLGDSLPECGGQCCPFGYTCAVPASNGSLGLCSIIQSTSSVNVTSTTSTSSTPTSTSTSSPTAAASNGTGIDSNNHPIVAHCSRFPAAAIAAGFFPGMIAGAFLALLLVICSGRRKNQTPKSSLYSQHNRNISEPIPTHHSNRSDFTRRPEMMLRHTQTRMKSWFSSKSSPTFLGEDTAYRGHDVPNDGEDNWKMPTPPVPNNVPLQPLGTTVPVTPERRIGALNHENLAHQPSRETIQVYSPDGMPASPRGARSGPVPPIRGMSSQWKANAAKLSPFKTPPYNTVHQATTITPDQGGVLTPARYGDGDSDICPRTREDPSDISRPTTTFTDMLHGIGFPDPKGRPDVPEVPKALNTRKGKR